jgi:hypothetical protein
MPTIETYRKQAKQLLRWHREKNYSMGEWVRKLERFRSFTDNQVLALKLTLTLAQEIVAVDAGYATWAELKSASAGAGKTPRNRSGPPLLEKVIPILLVRNVRHAPPSSSRSSVSRSTSFMAFPFLRRGIARWCPSASAFC